MLLSTIACDCGFLTAMGFTYITLVIFDNLINIIFFLVKII